MQKTDYFAESRSLFREIVALQKADANQRFVHLRFPAPEDEVAQVAKFAKALISKIADENGMIHFILIPFFTFSVKMIDGIVDKSAQPLLLDFTATKDEYEMIMYILAESLDRMSSEQKSTQKKIVGHTVEVQILLKSFLKRLQACNR
jgi:uroporphyrinogen-III decarboxylase